MKKFFELSILERKTVKGGTVLTAEMLSANDDVLGKLEICINVGEANAEAYVKYIPNEDENTAIASIRPITEDQDSLEEVLRELKEIIITSAMKDSSNMFFGIMLSNAIDAEAGKINLSIVPIPVTNSLISKILSSEWLGVEVKIDPQIQEVIGELAETKKADLASGMPDFLKS